MENYRHQIEEDLKYFAPPKRSYAFAAGFLFYLIVGWSLSFVPSNSIVPEFAGYFLLVVPLLTLAIINFQQTALWGSVWSVIWLPIYHVLVFFAKHFQAIFALALNVRNRLVKFKRPTADGDKVPEVIQVHDDTKTDSVVEASTDDDSGINDFLQSIRPRASSQVAAGLTWFAWLTLWLSPVFLEPSTGSAAARLVLGLFLPLLVLSTLLAIEFAYRPFPFWRVTTGMLWTPLYNYLLVLARILFFRPNWVQFVAKHVWLFRKLYYPAALFILFNRRYLTFLTATVAACTLCVIYNEGHWIAVSLCLVLYGIEAKRLIGQLREVRYLGVADFNDLNEVLRQKDDNTATEDKLDKSKSLLAALQRYIFVKLSRQVLDVAEGDDSYFATVVSILLKHIVMIGLAVAALRVFHVWGFRQNLEYPLDISDTVVNSLVLLFGEVTFDSTDGFLGIVNLLGVAASFLLLGLGLTYLSGTAHAEYKQKAKDLRSAVEEFEAGPEMTAVREGVLQQRSDGLQQLDYMDLMRLYARWNSKKA